MNDSSDLDWFTLERLYDQGRELFLRGEYEEAIDKFKRVYEDTFDLRDVMQIVDDYYSLPKEQWVAKYRDRFRRQNAERTLMKDLKSPTWIKLKGVLFFLVGIASAALLVLEHPTLKAGLLLALAVWCFCRSYYFAFYVIEHYVDPGYRFSGLGSFLAYLWRRRQ